VASAVRSPRAVKHRALVAKTDEHVGKVIAEAFVTLGCQMLVAQATASQAGKDARKADDAKRHLARTDSTEAPGERVSGLVTFLLKVGPSLRRVPRPVPTTRRVEVPSVR